MSRRFNSADALRWLEVSLAIDLAIDDPKSLGVANLVTPRSWLVLVYIGAKPDEVASYAEVRDCCRLAQNTMTRTVKALESARYVVRTYDANTGGLLLRLTPTGRNALGAIFSHAASRSVV